MYNSPVSLHLQIIRKSRKIGLNPIIAIVIGALSFGDISASSRFKTEVVNFRGY